MSRPATFLVLASATLSCGPSGSGPASTASSAPSVSAPLVSAASASPTASASAEGELDKGPAWIGMSQRTEAEINTVLNGKNLPPYTGKTGTLRGTVKITGDDPPDTTLDIPGGCAKANAMYRRLFRKGAGGELGDALVAVTQYEGFVPAASRAVQVTIDGCAFSSRTIALAYGQRIEVKNLDASASYMPYVDGAPFRAVLVALPGGNPVKLYAPEPRARYLLRDMMKNPYMLADVLVLAYATTDVTDADGTYEIRGIPVGKVRVDAYLPIIDKATGQEVDLHEGDNVLDLTLAYDAKTDVPAKVPAPIWGDRDPGGRGALPPAGASSAPPTSSAAPH